MAHKSIDFYGTIAGAYTRLSKIKTRH